MTEAPEERIRRIRSEIAELPGAWAFKDQVDRFINQAIVAQRRREAGLEAREPNNNMVVVGNPGTGKTVLTRKLGQLMHEMGLVRSPEVVQLQKADLGGGYVNTAAATTRELITKHRGKVIFIDEAYTLYNGPRDLAGREVVDELMRLSEEYRNDTVIVLAGYGPEMEQLFEANQGLKSRFPTRLDLPDLTPKEKGDVLAYQMREQKYRFASDKAERVARAYVARVPSAGENGNARAVRNFLELAQASQDERLASMTGPLRPEQFTELSVSDLQDAAARMGLPPMVTARPRSEARGRRSAAYRRRKAEDVVA